MLLPSDPAGHRAAPAQAKKGARGYALFAVLVVSVIILTGASTLVILTRETTLAGLHDKKGAEAHAVALAGLTYATLHLSTAAGLSALQTAAAGTAGTVVVAGETVAIQVFNADGEYAGAPAPPIVGASTAAWRAYGRGHFALFGVRDPQSDRSVLVRALGVVGQNKVLLETNLTLNVLQTVPAAMTACFDPNLFVTMYDQQGPYDFVGNMRFDGGGAFPIAMSVEHNRFNGLARCKTCDSSTGEPTTPGASGDSTARNRTWRGTQSLRAEPQASGVGNRYGGENVGTAADAYFSDVTIGVKQGWTANPYVGNDPRFADVSSRGGNGLIAVTDFVWAGGLPALETTLTKPVYPLVATKGAHNPATVDPYAAVPLLSVTTGYVWETEWAGNDDDEARKGMYACDNHSAASYANGDVEVCVKGSTGLNAPNYRNNAVNHSGRAFGIVQSVHRQCTGSGDSINPVDGSPWFDSVNNPNGVRCAPGFEWLENVAACLVLPRTLSWDPDEAAALTGASGYYQAGLVTGLANDTGSAPSNPDASLGIPAPWWAVGGSGSPWYDTATYPPSPVRLTDGDETRAENAYLSSLFTDPLDWSGFTLATASSWQGRVVKPGDGWWNNDFQGCHPGCALAADLNGDGTLDDADRPFRSACINLDSTTRTVYGPGVFPHKTANADGTVPLFVNGHPRSTVFHVKNGTLPPHTVSGGTNPYGDNWIAYNYAGADTNNAPTAAEFVPASPDQPAQFKGANGTFIGEGGAIAERGSLHLITRLDMTDRGPLGTCEQNCLAYGWGRDRTYGAHRTDVGSAPGSLATTSDRGCRAKVHDLDLATWPAPPAPGVNPTLAAMVYQRCNTDYDGDGLLDRYTYAISNTYREKCASPQDGIRWAPAVDISSDNGAIDPGCLNDLPNLGSGVTPQTLTAFCEDGSEAELSDAIAALETSATVVAMNTLTNTSGTLMKDDGWFGGAKCHMGTTRFSDGTDTVDPHSGGHSGNLASVPTSDTNRLGLPDYWIEDECPEPGVYKVDQNGAINVGKVCGCGVLILPKHRFNFNSGSSHFLWRGIVIWDTRTIGGEVLTMNQTEHDSFIIEGALVIYGANDWKVKITKTVDEGGEVAFPTSDTSLKVLFRYNQAAINDAFAAVRAPLRTVRRLH